MTDAPRDTGSLRVGMRFEYPTPNELIVAPTLGHAAINGHLFLPLLEEDSDFREGPPRWGPALAEDWEFSADRLALTMRLREDATWSDGVPVTAEDVRFTWLAQVDEAVAWTWAWAKAPIRDVEAVEPHTVRFHFDATSPTQLADAARDAVLPRHVWGKRPFAEWRGDPGWFFDNLVTSGPFRVENHVPGQELVLAASPNHFEAGLPRLDRVILRNAADADALATSLLAGELDLVTGIGPAQAERIEGRPDLRIETFSTRQYTFVAWNTTRTWFRDAATRRALAQAVNRQAIVDTVWRGYARVGASPILSDTWARDPGLEPWPWDPDAARAALAEAGWSDSDGDGILDRDGEAFRFELATFAGASGRWDAMQMMQADLRAVGIEAMPRRVDPNALLPRLLGNDFDAVLSGLAIDTTLDLRPTFHSESIGGGHNYAAWANPEVDALIERIGSRFEPEAGLEDFHRLQQILHRDQPVLVLWEPESLAAFDADLEFTAPSATNPLDSLETWAWRPPG